MTDTPPAPPADETETQEHVPSLLAELQQLHTTLTAAGTPCSLTTRPVDTLLIATDCGGIITIALTIDRASWWGNSSSATRIHDLEGDNGLTAAVLDELTHHARLAERTEFAA